MLNESLHEDGNGGQLTLRSFEIEQTESIYTMVYLAMFAGQLQEATTKETVSGELFFTWWGNDTNDNSDKWINSNTERVLRGIELSSQSRFVIQRAVESDMQSLSQLGEFEVLITYPALNRVEINITIKEPGIKDSERLVLLWDATRNEIIERNIL